MEEKNGRKRRKISLKRKNCCRWADGWRNIESSSIGGPNASGLFLDFPEWVLTKHQRSLTRANVICAKNLLSFEGILKILCYVWLIDDQMLSKPLASFYAESLLKNSFTTPLGESLSPSLDLESLFMQDHYWWLCAFILPLFICFFVGTMSDDLAFLSPIFHLPIISNPFVSNWLSKQGFGNMINVNGWWNLLVTAPWLSTTGWCWWWGKCIW